VRFTLSRSGRLARSISAITLMSAGSAYGAAAIEEIVVTAQKRPEAIQDVPLAVSAFSGEFVRDRQLDDVKDLVLYTPGVTGDSKDSFIDTLSIRGIITNDFGVGGDPSIGVFKNNLYQGRNGAVVTSLYDLERAEVLRGPQGFLFGRNSIAGAISVYTVRPSFDDYDGYLELDVAERNHIVAEGAVNIPVNDNLAFRIAGYHAEEDGYSENRYDPSQDDLIAPDKNAGRLSARYQNDKLEVNAMIEYEVRDQSGSIYRATEKGETWDQLQALFGPFEMGGDDIDINSNMGLGERDNGKVFSSGLHVDYDLGFAGFNSSTGYRHHNYKYAEDFDATQLGINDYAQDQNGEYFEQEFRLVSQSDGPLSWYTGVSLYHEQINVLFSQKGDEDVMCVYYYGATCSDYFPGFTYDPQGLLEQNSVKGNYKGWGTYVDLTYAITDKLDASLGVRYTYDQKRFKLFALPVTSELGPFFAFGYTTDGYLADSDDWSEVTPRALVEYHPNDDWMLFGSVTRGYKAGGFGSFAIDPDVPFGTIGVTSAEANPDSFDPETAWSYEIGAKGDLLDGTMRVGVNTYFYDYEDLQVNVPGVGGGIVVDNVGQVDGWGVEGTMEYAITDNLDMLLNAAYADSKVNGAEAICDDTNVCDGEPLPQVPEYSGSAVVNLHFPARDGEISFTYELYAQAKTYGGLLQLSEAVNDSYADMALRGGYQSNSGWGVIAYVENLTDEVHYDGVAEGGGILPAHYFGPSRPRTVGVRMTWEF
jgi:iron complex outermembrane recepter protein